MPPNKGMARESVEPKAAVMIGDRAADVRAAKASGVRSIGVLWGYGDLAELTAAGATRTAARPAELPEIVGELACE